jgi:hypothetical protein
MIELEALTMTLTNSDAFDDTPFLGLLGRDVLNLGEFLHSGPGRFCRLAF